jgi:hypothetical protein
MLTSGAHPAGLFGPTIAHALSLADPLAKAVPRKGSAHTDGDGSEARRIRWIETGPRRDPRVPWNADFNTKILWVDEPDISSEEIYAREYTDGRRVNDPIKLAEALSRYLMNKTIAGSAALALQIEPVFVWLPAPLYKYDLNLHPFHIQDEQRRSKYGYEMLARHIQSHDMGPGFVWCADIQQGVRQPLYGDQVHYSVRASPLIAGRVADAIFRRGILDRAWQKKFESNTAAAIRSAYSIDAGGRIADTVKRIGFLFDAGAVVNHLQMSHPLEDWREISSDGIVLTDNSSGIADISQEFPIGDV